MRLLIRSIETLNDIDDCVSISEKLASNHLIPMDIKKCRESMTMAARRKKYLRVGEYRNEVRCWIFAEVVSYPHVKDKIFQQMYYATNLEGLVACHAAIEMHEDMSKMAQKLGCKYAMSSSSCYGDDLSMSRLLERHGWLRKGNLVVRVFQ